jgi:hypothetical protein
VSEHLCRTVRRVLRQFRLNGVTSTSGVARSFGIRERTSRQRLHAERTSLQELLEPTRFELARQP